MNLYLLFTFIVLCLSLPCDDVTQYFTDCISNNLLSGSCTLNSTGLLNYCPPCRDYYSGWIDCHCNDLVVPYGFANCHSFCSMYFSCESTVSFNNTFCKDYSRLLTECAHNSPKSNNNRDYNIKYNNIAKKVMGVKVSITKEFVSPPGDIPYAHVCSITQNPAGDLVAVFQAGSHENFPDLAILASMRTNNQWSKPAIAVKTPDVCDMNPSLFSDVTTGRIYLTFHYGGGAAGRCDTRKWKGAYVISDNGGVTWSDSINYLPDGFLGAIKNQCIKLSTGDVLCPSSREAIINGSIPFSYSIVERTTPTFSTWKKSNDIMFNYNNGSFNLEGGNIQPVLFETAPGQVLALLRTGSRVLAFTRSTDGGITFDEFASPSPFPNPNAGVGGTVMMQEENLGLILAYNNSTELRNPLSLSHSVDGGKTWDFIANIEYDPSNKTRYHYPTVIQDKTDSKVAHVCYSIGNAIGYAKLQFSYT